MSQLELLQVLIPNLGHKTATKFILLIIPEVGRQVLLVGRVSGRTAVVEKDTDLALTRLLSWLLFLRLNFFVK